MQDVKPPNPLVETLERLLDIPTGDLETTLLQVSDVIADVLKADKIDVFLYDDARDSLAAICSSSQPLSALQRKLGLDVLPLTNGGRVVWVYKTWQTFTTGDLQADPEELRGVKEGLGIRSKIGVPLEIAGKRRGMVMIASLRPDFFSAADVQCAEFLVRWTGVLAHRADLAEEMRRNTMQQSRREVAEELVTVVAHDMRNYLAPIELRLHALRKIVTGTPRSEQILAEVGHISRGLRQLRSLIGDLLDVARLDHGLFRIDPEVVDLAALIRDSTEALASPQVGLLVRVQSTGEILVFADGARLRQCIDNLIANAVQQSPAGATVTVTIGTQTSTDGERARVEVIDEGPGVPTEIMPRIFERHASSKGRAGGLGLGLFLAKRIAELHGGDIEVESEPGRGARFVLHVPCEPHTTGADSASAPSQT